jgi:hypothetical protein
MYSDEQHALSSRIAESIDVEGGIFENVHCYTT